MFNVKGDKNENIIMMQVDVDPLIYDPLFFVLSKSLSLDPLFKNKSANSDEKQAQIVSTKKFVRLRINVSCAKS